MKKVWIVVSLASILILGGTSIAFAERPLATDDTGTMEPGHLQVELGSTYSHTHSTHTKDWLTAIALTTGITKRIDIGLEIPYESPEVGEDGFGDMTTRIKYRFLNEKGKRPSLALKWTQKWDTGSVADGLGTGNVEHTFTGILTKGFGRFTTHLNFGYIFLAGAKTGSRGERPTYGAAGEYALTDKFNLVAEVTGSRQSDPTVHRDPCSALAGFNYELPNGIILDAGYGVGLTTASPDSTVTFGLTYEF